MAVKVNAGEVPNSILPFIGPFVEGVAVGLL